MDGPPPNSMAIKLPPNWPYRATQRMGNLGYGESLVDVEFEKSFLWEPKSRCVIVLSWKQGDSFSSEAMINCLPRHTKMVGDFVNRPPLLQIEISNAFE